MCQMMKRPVALHISINRMFRIACCLLLSAFLALCGCSGNSGTRHGSFIDSAVEGLSYETETLSGTTDSDGSFSYNSGESVTFFIGGIKLGSAAAQTYITPLDLVTGAQNENNPTVINIVRLLITLDEDNNPENGITIPPEINDALSGVSINFSQDNSSFADDAALKGALATANRIYEASGQPSRAFCTEDLAISHLAASLADLQSRGYEHSGNAGGGAGSGGGCG